MEGEFQGRGIRIPVSISATGGLAESADTRKIEEAIRVILGTRPGERLMRPTFGSALKSLVFAPLSAATANLARHYTEDALLRWEARIDVLDVTTENMGVDGLGRDGLLIQIRYRIKATHDVHSMIYPFYLEQV